MRALVWLVGHALLYLLLSVVCWTAWGLLLGGASGMVLCAFLVAFSFYAGLFCGLTCLILSGLAALYFLGLWVSIRTLRWTALIVPSLLIVLYAVAYGPSADSGEALLVDIPIQIAFACLMRPVPGSDESLEREYDRFWDPPPDGLRDPATFPLREGPGRSWYAVLLGVLLWMGLFFAAGYPLLLSQVPFGSQRVAQAVAGPADDVRLVADPNVRYVIYQDYHPEDGGDLCIFSGAQWEPGEWGWFWPLGTVSHNGRTYRYVGVMSDAEGTVEMGCAAGPLLVVDASTVRSSPARSVAIAALSLPVLGIAYVAWTRRRAQRYGRDRAEPASPAEEATR